MINSTAKKIFLKEMFRKSIHLGSLFFPLSYHFSSKNFVLILSIAFIILMAIVEYLRFFNTKLYKHIKNLSKILRVHEAHNLTGASYMAISMLICIIFFPKILVITAFFILAISDTLAALIGMRFGKIKLFDKTIEGCLAFFISSVLICHIIMNLYSIANIDNLAIFFICFITTITELVSKKLQLDDNLSIPLTFCTATLIIC